MGKKLGKFRNPVAKIRYSPSKVSSQLKNDACDYLCQLELLRRGVSCRKKSAGECRRLAAVDYGFICDPSKAADFSLHDFPKNVRGEEAAETLVCLTLLQFEIQCERTGKSHTDRLAFPAFREGARRTPMQIKSMSLAKHGYEIEIQPRALEEFEGWYIVLIEHEPHDYLLFVSDSEMREKFKKAELRYPEKSVGSQTLRLTIPRARFNDWLKYRDPNKFIEDVRQK